MQFISHIVKNREKTLKNFKIKNGYERSETKVTLYCGYPIDG